MTTAIYVWLIAACSVFTYLTRLPGLWFGRMIRVTPRLKRGLDSIPVGVFAAMVIPSLISGVIKPSSVAHATLLTHINWPFTLAAVVAIVVALWTKHPLWTMLSGVVAIALLRLV